MSICSWCALCGKSFLFICFSPGLMWQHIFCVSVTCNVFVFIDNDMDVASRQCWLLYQLFVGNLHFLCMIFRNQLQFQLPPMDIRLCGTILALLVFIAFRDAVSRNQSEEKCGKPCPWTTASRFHRYQMLNTHTHRHSKIRWSMFYVVLQYTIWHWRTSWHYLVNCHIVSNCLCSFHNFSLDYM